MAETPIIDRLKIGTTMDEQARAKGYADYTAELDADYEAWRQHAGATD